jgi:hypothetical protein
MNGGRIMEWINTTDKFPDQTPATENKTDTETDTVIVHDYDGTITTGFFCHEEDNWYLEDGSDIFGNITHWMPLPNPPKVD